VACCAHTAHGPASHGPAFLAELGGVRAGQRPDSDWAVRLSAARDEPERRLLDVSMSMSSLCLEFMTSWFEAPFGRSNVSYANEIGGAKRGANARRYRATPGHDQRLSVRVNGTLDHTQPHLATSGVPPKQPLARSNPARPHGQAEARA
jgi:hypothetical protein